MTRGRRNARGTRQRSRNGRGHSGPRRGHIADTHKRGRQGMPTRARPGFAFSVP